LVYSQTYKFKKSAFSFVYEAAKHEESLLTETIMTLASTDLISQFLLIKKKKKVFFLPLNNEVSLLKGLVRL
jgi:hypothetical protein